MTVPELSSQLEADKRAGRAYKLAEIADVGVETELRIGRKGNKGARPMRNVALTLKNFRSHEDTILDLD